MGDIEVDGDRNRVAGRDYIEVHVAPGKEPLSVDQRKRLNTLVTNISKEYKVDPWTLWREVVHTRIGVSKIDEIPRDRFTEAEQALLMHAEHLHAQAHAKRLVAEALQVANEKGVYQELIRFSSREFGSTVLNKLNPEQLKQALRFVEDAAPPQHGQSQAETEAEPVPAAPAVAPDVSFAAEVKALASQYPMHCGALALALMILGKMV